MLSTIATLITDATCIFIVGIPIYFYTSFPVFHRGFFCDDENLRYPHKKDTISDFLLHFVSVTTNVLIIIIFETYKHRKTDFKTKICKLYRILSIFIFAHLMTESVSDFCKLSLGRLRPYFLDVCRPNGTLLEKYCTNSQGFHVYVEENVCTGDIAAITHARQSFPSGHAAISAFASIFLALYLESRWRCSKFKLLKPLFQSGAIFLAIWCALTRIIDYKHHWTDVLGGFILGTIVSVCFVFFVSDLFKSETEEESYALIDKQSDGEKRRLLG